MAACWPLARTSNSPQASPRIDLGTGTCEGTVLGCWSTALVLRQVSSTIRGDATPFSTVARERRGRAYLLGTKAARASLCKIRRVCRFKRQITVRGGGRHEDEQEFATRVRVRCGLCGRDLPGGRCAGASAGRKADGLRASGLSLAGILEGWADPRSDQYQWRNWSQPRFRGCRPRGRHPERGR